MRELGHVNLWADSQNYNITEAAHSVWIFCVADMLMEDVANTAHEAL